MFVEKQKIRGKLKHHLFFTFTLYRATLVKNELVKNSSVKNGVFYFLLFTTIVNGLSTLAVHRPSEFQRNPDGGKI